MKKKRDSVEMIGFAVTRPTCSEPGCSNKARRIAKRKYGSTCHLHIHHYYAA